MTYTYEELKKKTVADLREIAKGLQHEAVQGYTQLNKAHLLPALCTALGIEAHEHHEAALGKKEGIKARLREIRADRGRALEAGNREELHRLRRQYHHLNHSLRASAKHATLH